MTHGVQKAEREVPQRRERSVETVWRFCLVVEPAEPNPPWRERPFPIDQAAVRALGRGATVLEEPFDPVVRVRFDWPAATWAQAVVEAIRGVESCRLRVVRVDNDDCVTATDIADRIGYSREGVRCWITGRHSPGGFPRPINPRRDTTFYSWAEVLPWLRERKGLDLPGADPTLVAADLAVRLRALMPRVRRPEAILGLLRVSPMNGANRERSPTVEIDGTKLRDGRKAMGDDLKAFAARVGITIQYLSQLELGVRRRVSPSAFVKICEALNLDRRDLIVRGSWGPHGVDLNP